MGKLLDSLLEVNGDIEFYETTLDGRHTAYGISSYNDVKIKKLYFQMWNAQAYCSHESRDSDYIQDVSIEYRGRGGRLMIYVDENGRYYIKESLSSNHSLKHLIPNGTYLPINFEELLKAIDLSLQDVIPLKEMEREFRTKKPVEIGYKVNYTDDDGFKRKAEVLEVLNCRSLKDENGEIKYKGNYRIKVIE